METVKVRDLNLADIVRAFDGPFGDCVVRKKQANGNAVLFRPYGAHGDFSYTGGVVPYIGIEEFEVGASQEITRVRRADPLR